jgi:large subunit ribosomal protein L6
MAKIGIHLKIEVPEGVMVKLDKNILTVKGPKGELSRKFTSKKIKIDCKGNAVELTAHKATKREKMLAGTFESHIKNMIKGVKEPYVYELKICSSHFPMTAEIKQNVLYVNNLLGESLPRTMTIRKGVTVTVNGAIIKVESLDIELAGMTASAIEELCKIRDKDRRVFQDGVYIISKAGQKVE